MNLRIEAVESLLKAVIKDYCLSLDIDVKVDNGFCPGEFIKSQVLLTAIDEIADALEITIPNDCYIFSNKENKQLSITETAQKIIQVVKMETISI